jgi:hypothetical protein
MNSKKVVDKFNPRTTWSKLASSHALASSQVELQLSDTVQSDVRNGINHSGDRTLRSKMTEEILSASTKNIELAQLRTLIHESIIHITSRSGDTSISQLTSAEYSQIAVRVCLYYEVALNLGYAIATSVSKIASSINASCNVAEDNDQVPNSALNESIHQVKMSKINPRFEEFLIKNRDSLRLLRSERKRALHITLSAIHSFDPNSPAKSKARLFMLAKYKEDRIQAICVTVQSLLQLLNELLNEAQPTSGLVARIVP